MNRRHKGWRANLRDRIFKRGFLAGLDVKFILVFVRKNSRVWDLLLQCVCSPYDRNIALAEEDICRHPKCLLENDISLFRIWNTSMDLWQLCILDYLYARFPEMTDVYVFAQAISNTHFIWTSEYMRSDFAHYRRSSFTVISRERRYSPPLATDTRMSNYTLSTLYIGLL